jgi:hypothetical protein
VNGPDPPLLTPARAVALALIAGLVCGLAYLRFGTGSEPVAVPPGAEAGDLVLERCEYSTEDGTYDADCGTLVVPENRADPGSRLIALREQSRLHLAGRQRGAVDGRQERPRADASNQVDVVLDECSPQRDMARIRRRGFCGWRGIRCGGGC